MPKLCEILHQEGRRASGLFGTRRLSRTRIMPQQSPKAFDVERAQSRLGSRSLYYFPSLDSTMREAARLASSGCATGTAVVTDKQTAGQGRHGHAWHSEDRSGLYVSIVLRLALAVKDAIRTGRTVEIN